MDFITSDGIRLNYQEYGNGMPIIFVHGFSGCQEIWTEQIDFFVEHGFRVITYDQRNHGASQIDENLSDIFVLVRDLKELIEHLCKQNPIIVGHSMGASVAYGILGQYQNLVKAVVAVDQSPKMVEDDEWHYGFMHATRTNCRAKAEQLPHIRQTLHGVTDKTRQKVKNAQRQFPFDWQLNKKLLYSHVRVDWRKDIVNANVPVLLITANQSPFYDGRYADVMCQENPKFVSHIAIDQTGHCVMAEQPTEFNQDVLSFIKNLK